ncbi:YhgE/Pip family protein [Rummeliibacillus sp. NPDC094406]|uniref:YhgE/Pip family protein n=1 Tax=Rummeliibacillus sp. NPDC094406 TaxID=3364511 RepID=UPI0037F3613E
MKNSWKIYLNDLKSIRTNWVSAIIISGLIILPSLYAWLNIAASWDPYGKTNQIPVGIVNEDTGATVQGKTFNAGNELISKLKNSNDMDWQFTNRTKALDHLNNGDYFSVIIIPKNFSHDLASVVNENPHKAQLEYFVNEKINSIAPKITSSGASVLVDSMSSQFIGTVNGTIFDIFNRIGIAMKQDLPDIEKLKSFVFTLEKDLPSIYSKIKSAQQDVNKASQIVNYAKKEIPKTEILTSQGLTTVNDTLNFIDQAETQLNAISPQVKKDMQTVQQIATDANKLLTQLKQANISFTEIETVKNNLDNRVTEAIDKISTINQLLLSLKQYNLENKSSTNSKTLDQAIAQTEATSKILNNAQTNAREMDTALGNKEQEITNSINQLQRIATNTSVELDRFVKEYTQTVEPTIFEQIHRAKQTLIGAKETLTDIQGTIPKVATLLNNTDGFIYDTQKGIQTFVSEYPYVNERVHRLADKIRTLEKETDLTSIIQLLINNPIAEKSFFEQPIKMNEHRVFPIENYGTGMAPFYTVLAIWVGCLLLISLLSVDTKQVDDFEIREVYFGKLLTFWTIGILQTIIIVLGNIFILKVSVHDPFWFIVFCLFISLVFMSIVYTLVSVFGDVGKALSIVLLVLQLAGSGGTFPVVLLPKFFQILNPFLPFTYAISLAREAIGGIIWTKVRTDFIFLFVVLVIVLLFGSIFKKQLRNLTQNMLRKSRKSGLFH